ncbi:anthrax toxin receptor-like [Diceros bicornis minor]|uniref:anthrax toxin receptor-like n=1 Tax=Diceros bicornis minor TaxID=77932 RepID=UPI0026E929C5|nr:anthrax toxin receptor-like [Diceros bicornis minor]
MGSGGPAVPGPALLLLLLSVGSFPHSLQGSPDFQGLGLDWGRFQHHRLLSPDRGRFHHIRGPSAWPQESQKEEEPKSCGSSYDLYFMLDMSGSVNNNWMDVYNFVDEVVKKFENPKLRISFITYSTQGHTLLKLTSDR